MEILKVHKNKDIYFKYINEQWREYPENIQYSVSCMGRIKSIEKKVKHNYGGMAIKKERILTQTSCNGYLSVGLTDNGKTKNTRVSRIVAITWIKNPENKPQVNHINGEKYDNRMENLEWNTSGENIMHAWNNGLAKKIESYIELQKRIDIILKYACHDVKVQTPKGIGRIVIKSTRMQIQYEDGQLENLIKSIRFWGNNFKLILHKLSDLTKEGEYNGKKFVPLAELYRIYSGEQPVYDSIHHDSDSYGLKYKGSVYFWVYTPSFSFIGRSGINNQLELFNKLFEWHFWIFDQSYFEKGIVLDINSLNKK